MQKQLGSIDGGLRVGGLSMLVTVGQQPTQPLALHREGEDFLLGTVVEVALQPGALGIAVLEDPTPGLPQCGNLQLQPQLQSFVADGDSRRVANADEQGIGRQAGIVVDDPDEARSVNQFGAHSPLPEGPSGRPERSTTTPPPTWWPMAKPARAVPRRERPGNRHPVPVRGRADAFHSQHQPESCQHKTGKHERDADSGDYVKGTGYRARGPRVFPLPTP